MTGETEIRDLSKSHETEQPGSPELQFALLSHDLRSALAGITGGLSQINAEALGAADRLQLDRVLLDAKILADLMARALDDGQAGGGAVHVNLAQFLNRKDRKWRANAAEKGIGWQLVREGRLPLSLKLPELTGARALGNVLANAIKYTDAGQVTLTARVNPDGALELIVTDDGPGFSAAALETLFEAYGRPADSAKPGTGLGLHIAKTLLDAAGAGITIRNRAEGGAEVRLIFPAALLVWPDSRSGPVPAASGNERDAAPVMPDLSGLRVLLAEDNKTNQMVATQMLTSMNASVTVASDGYEALMRFDAGDFDIALLDIEMPRMSGLDVLRAIRGRGDARAHTPLVALTAYAMREHKERITAAGANGLIAKPLISIEDFGNAVLSYLRPGHGGRIGSDGAAAPAGLPVTAIDRGIYDALAETIGRDSIGELIDKVAEDLVQVKHGIAEGASAHDMQRIRANTHILVSVAGAIGATGLQHLAGRLNAAAHAASDQTVTTLADECIAGIAEAEAFLFRERDGIGQAR